MNVRTLAAVAACAAAASLAEVKSLAVTGAPFELTVAEWTPPDRSFAVTDYGARPDGKPVTEAIEKAIAAAHAAGGGKVAFPKGEWISGAFKMKSDVALVVPEGATLRFPDDPVIVYRAPLKANGRPTPTQGGLIEALGCTNVAILGKGTLKADVDYWHRNFNVNPQRGFPRPQFFSFKDCRNVRFEGFRVRGSPAWTMHFTTCEDIVLRDLDSVCTGPNTDGLDLESCNRALVERVSLDQTDDTFTIKSGFNELGRKRNKPTQNVVIRNCKAVHGHSLLGIGSEVSGGIRNIYMTDSEVESECWNWLFVKTNSKRGAFVENVTLENIRGRRANQAVMNVEMFYDGNPNKELTKKGGSEFITRIAGITCRNVVCEEAGLAVKVRGDKSLPPKGLRAENIRVGRLREGRTEPVSAMNAPDLAVKDVRVDPTAIREVCGLPPQVRPCDPAEDADASVAFDRLAFEELSDNDGIRRVIEARVAAEVAAGRNCAPAVTPREESQLPERFEGNHMKRFGEMLAELGCALPGAHIADDVRRVARAGADGKAAAYPGLALTLEPDERERTVRIRFVNGGRDDLADVWCVVHLPFNLMTRRQTFRVDRIAAGAAFEKTLDFGAGAHYVPRPVGQSPYAVEADFTCGGVRSRLWATKYVPVKEDLVLPVRAARCAGPMDAEGADDETLALISAGRGPLPALEGSGGEWRSPEFPGAAWYNVTGPSRPYTETEKGLVRAKRAVEVVALQFDAPEFAQVTVRCLPWLWDHHAVMFLNGERIPLDGKVMALPAKTGFNRLVVRFASEPGERKACAQLAVYTWSVTDHVPCVPFESSQKESATGSATNRGGTPAPGAAFPLEWSVGYDTSVPYEVDISRRKLAKFSGVSEACGFEVRATLADGSVHTPGVTVLPSRNEGCIRMRFAVPKGTVKLACEAKGTSAVADPDRIADNLFAGASSAPAVWQTTPRVDAKADPEGGILFQVNDWGGPEASFTAEVPPQFAGKGVVFEAETENVGAESVSREMRIEQYDADGTLIPESVVDRRWTAHVCPPGFRTHYLEEGRLHSKAVKVRAYMRFGSAPRTFDYHGVKRTEADRNDRKRLAKHRLTRLSLRPAAVLPFPKYDDAFFTAGVSGEPGDTALRLGGDSGKAFWYQTRSNASWSDRRQLRDESLVFFPSGAGTVEAWFKSPWRPIMYKDAKVALKSRPYTLFEAYHGFHATEHRAGCGTEIQLSYVPEPGRLVLFFREPTSKGSWTGEAPVKLPADAWCHVALQWTPKGAAEVFVDGRKALTLAIPEWKGCDLKDETVKVVNDANAQEFFIGSACKSARLNKKVQEDWPLLEGALDLFRASTGKRYAGDFTPAKNCELDAATRALFRFDRCFDGVSSGGLAWIPGTIRALSDRVDHTLPLNGGSVQYWPKVPLAENDPHVVFDIVNYPVLPRPADFEAAHKPFVQSATLKPGEAFSFEAPADAVTDYVEIANPSKTPLALPILLNDGDIDPRSFGDLADTLGLAGLSPRGRANKVFQFVLSAADYFPLHTAKFAPGSDAPFDVEYDSFTMLNGYCGFECGPLNHLTANLFAAVAGCPSSETPGYAHQFMQVFFEGKNHLYDLSAQKFFPAWDNETSAYLKEAGDQPGLFIRYDMTGDHFIRMGDRGFWLFTPHDVRKIGVTLNPGERFRVWQVNDGNCNDLIAEAKTGVYRGGKSKAKIDMDEETHADTSRNYIQQVNRFFPHYLSGFLAFDGKPDASNPAFTEVKPDSFCYVVDSGYPITRATYAARRNDGGPAVIELSTDCGKTFRPLASPATYAVRARFAYLVRVRAPIADVTRFSAETEVQLNPRVFPGRIKPGRNVYTLKAMAGAEARVAVAGRAAAKRVTVRGRAAYAGAIKGAEKLFTAFDSAKTRELELVGLSSAAAVKAFGSVSAELVGGKLTLRAKDPAQTGFGAAVVVDGGAEKEIVTYTGPGVRFATADDAAVEGAMASVRDPDATSPQKCVVFKGHCGDGSGASFSFDPMAAGKYAVFNLNRFVSHPEAKAPEDLRMIWAGDDRPSYGCGSPRNEAINFWKTNFGRPGERANFKWDFGQGSSEIDVPASDKIKMFSWRPDPVEVAAVLVVPAPDRAARAELLKFLCGLNADPWRIAAAGK